MSRSSTAARPLTICTYPEVCSHLVASNENIKKQSQLEKCFTCFFVLFFPPSAPSGLRAERCHRHGDLRCLPAPELPAEAGGAAAGCGRLLLPHPPGLPRPHTPRRAAQVRARGCPCSFFFKCLYTRKNQTSLLHCLEQHVRCSLEAPNDDVTLFRPSRDITRHAKFASSQ